MGNYNTTEDITFALVGGEEESKYVPYQYTPETKNRAQTARDRLNGIKFPLHGYAERVCKILIKVLQQCCSDELSMGFMCGWMVVKAMEVRDSGGVAIPKHAGMQYDFGPAYTNVCRCIHMAMDQLEIRSVATQARVVHFHMHTHTHIHTHAHTHTHTRTHTHNHSVFCKVNRPIANHLAENVAILETFGLCRWKPIQGCVPFMEDKEFMSDHRLVVCEGDQLHLDCMGFLGPSNAPSFFNIGNHKCAE